ncbi:conserved membrane hypothetical protein [Candidatus Zixiibacteriota bacterium]|nr:conserved membrane hypothetical protein [candidate division Zixibacteria bacterium]
MADSFFLKDDEVSTQAKIPPLDEGEDEKAKEADLLKDQGMIASILAYIPFLCLIPLLQMRENQEARFHSKQGLLLFLLEIMAGLFLIPGLSSTIWKTVLIVALGAAAAGIVFGIQGKSYRLPFLSDIADKMKI